MFYWLYWFRCVDDIDDFFFCFADNFTESASSSGLNLSDIRTILEGFGLVTFVIIIVTVIVVRKSTSQQFKFINVQYAF